MPSQINPMEVYDYAMKGVEQGRERGKQSRLGQLYSQALQAPQEQRSGLLGLVAQTSPDAVAPIQKSLGALDDAKHAAVGRAAQMLLAAPEDSRPQLWSRIVSDLTAQGITGMKPDYDPIAVPAMAQKIAAAYGGGDQSALAPKVVGDALVDASTGKVLYQGQSQVKPIFQTDAQGNGYWLTPGQAPVPVDFAGQQFTGGAAQVLDNALTSTVDPLQIQSQFKTLAQGFPGVQISSLQRTPQHNAEVGGVANSQHIRGTAGDFVVPPQERAAFIAKAKAQGFEAIDEGDHVHLELPPNRGQVAQAGGRINFGKPISQSEQARLDLAKDANRRANEAAQRAREAADRAARGTPPAGYRWNEAGTALEPIPGSPKSQGEEAQKQGVYAKTLAQDALAFAAAFTGIPQADLAKLSPQEVRQKILDNDRASAGPIVGSIWGMDKLANADLAAYSNSAAGKQARINNPTGPVTNADFEVARKSVFSADKPKSVNADLVYQALLRAKSAESAAPVDAKPAPANGGVLRYNPATGDFE